ncbi:TPR repeat [Flavobacterium sp. CF108]|uniref:tetratricopeptide repeat protein n=1 Tax=unclassified Flavobacterium TaxID=196869 RepID=UPI0008C2958A|nr:MULTISPECIES: tetratricopeptide repeat protein [unclassified Flavobacterium]SEN93417.1 TPR repeat [Flavobacterium sp. fv08]SHH27773.1 TPR repeat [Flavobacterium sp. CF108]
MNNENFKAGNWFIDQLNLYQSANSDFKSVKNNFIIREMEFEIIAKSLLSKKISDPLQHELILGRRGSGKSTLLKRIEIEICENAKLNKKYIPINLAEEQAGVYRLFDLWEQVLEEIKYQLNIDLVLTEFSEFNSNDDYTNYLYRLIHDICKKYKKRIVLILDNFDRIVENFIDDGNLLRETLINYNDIQIIAGSTRMDEHFWRYDMPFYEFFRRHRLETLSKEEILKLLNHWSSSLDIPELKIYLESNIGKIENIRILTDGLPRTLQFFIQMVLQNTDLNSYDYLKKIMDNVTPLYQERLNSLPPQLRKTVLELAFVWEACTTKKLVEKVKMESKLISANLKTLVEKGVVDRIETSKKNHLYRISERFFNMWLIITQGNPEQKRKAKWLSIFLENWYDAKDLKKIAGIHIQNLKNKDITWDKALIFSKGLCQSRYISTLERDSIIELTERIRDTGNNSFLIELPEKFNKIYDNIMEFLEAGKYSKALDLINGIENEEDGVKFNLLGYVYEKLDNPINAEKFYLKSINKDHTNAFFNLSLLYSDLNRIEDAEKFYLKACEKGINMAMYNLGNLYVNQNENKKAENFYLLAIENGVVEAYNNLGLLYFYQKKYDEAEENYLLGIKNNDINSMFNLAILYRTQGKYEDAKFYYLLASKNGIDVALDDLALMYEKIGDFDKAEKYYLLSIKKQYFESLENLAILYHKQERYEKAEKYYLLAIEKKKVNSLNNLAYLYYELNVKKEESLKLIEECVESKKSTISLETQLIVEIWNGIFSNIEERINSIVSEKKGNDLEDFLFDLLVQQQKKIVFQLFQNQDFGKILQEKYIVFYYVVLLLNNNQEENLSLRIPPELKETIDDVILRIHEKEYLYDYK